MHGNVVLLMLFGALTSKLLLMVHAIAAAVFIGNATHLALHAWRGLRQEQALGKMGRQLRFLPFSFGAAFISGLTIYPTFRVNVRAAYLDVKLPLLTGLFEAKEHWMGASIFVVILLVALTAGGAMRRDGVRRPVALAAVVLSFAAWSAGLVGLVLAVTRPI